MAKNKEIKISSFMKKILPSNINEKVKNENNIIKNIYPLIQKELKYSSKELNLLYKTIFTPYESHPSSNSKINIDSLIGDYFTSLYTHITNNKSSYNKIIKLEPKIEQSEIVIIPNILSPNSMKPYELKLIFNNENINNILDLDIQDELLTFTCNYIQEKLKLDDRLYSWVKDALFIYGSKPVMILPISIINNIRNLSLSTENTKEKLFIDMNYIIDESINNIDIETINYRISNEVINEIINIEPNININKNNRQDINNYIKIAYETIIKEIKGFVELSGDISDIVKGTHKNHLTNQQIIELYDKLYNSSSNKSLSFKQETIINLNDYFKFNEESSEIPPILVELPPESVIPIFTKGNPENHLGYIIVLDDDYQPISYNEFEEEKYTPEMLQQLFSDYGSSLLEKTNYVSKNHGLRLNKGLNSLVKNNKVISKLMSKVGEVFLDNIIKNIFKNIGFTNIDFNTTSNLTNNLFFRLLKHKKTKFIFVPEFMMMYLAFKYNENGTGISKIEEISFLLSLKITFLVTKIFRMIENAVNTTEIKLSLDEGISNPLEFVYKLKSLLIKNRAVDLTYDPINIIKSLVDRQYSFLIDNIPGVKSFNIEKSTTNKNNNLPDDSLLEFIDNLITILLEIPASAYNQLNENEYSRSIATMNAIFSLKISYRRKIIIKHVSKLIRNYISFDINLQNKLKEILKNRLKDSNSKYKDQDLDKLLMYIIKYISIFIPEPKIVFDKSEFENANEYLNFISDFVDKLYPQELTSDRDSQDLLKTISTHIKCQLYKHFLLKSDLIIGSNEVLQDLEKIDIIKMFETDQVIQNYKKLLDDYKKKITKSNKENSGNAW